MIFKKRIGRLLLWALGLGCISPGLAAQDVRAVVSHAVQAELAADAKDHSRWLYFEVDKRPKRNLTQWTAETESGSLKRVLTENGKKLSPAEQKKQMDAFSGNPEKQAEQRKSGEQDDKQATELLKLLPRAFVWTDEGSSHGLRRMHFKPDSHFHPPDREARVFAAMEGDMEIQSSENRIVSLKGRLTRDVTFGGGLFARLKKGGSFDVERRETAPGIWQITETHVHIGGHALFFKNISQEEDDVKTKFHQLPGGISMKDAEQELMKQPE